MLFTNTSCCSVCLRLSSRLQGLHHSFPPLLPVFYKPYESRGQAWPITFNRLVWGVIMFQIFMIGIFSLSKSVVLSILMVPVLAFTIWWAWYMDTVFTPLSQFTNLDSVYEVQRGETDEMSRLTDGEPVSSSHTYVHVSYEVAPDAGVTELMYS